MKSQVPSAKNRSPRAAKPASSANGAPAPTCVEIQVPLRPETIRRLEALAKLQGKSFNEVILDAVSQKLFGIGAPCALESATSSALALLYVMSHIPPAGELPTGRYGQLVEFGLNEIRHSVEHRLMQATDHAYAAMGKSAPVTEANADRV